MNMHWFPKHMATARRQIAETLPRCDVVLEVLDARCPAASSNAMLAELSQGKPALKLLAKPDLADPAITENWIRYLELASASLDPKSNRSRHVLRLLKQLEDLDS